jgi:hypothetical protein
MGKNAQDRAKKRQRSKTAAAWIERLSEINPDAVILDGFDTCIVGIAERFGVSPVLAYDYDRCIKVLMAGGMDYDGAVEYFEFNTLGGWFGDGTPVFVTLKL